MSGRTGLLFLGAPAVPEMIKLARQAEAAGFESAWVAETRLTRDAITPVAALALATERMRIGTGIVNVYTRGPVLLALTFATLDELAPGRIAMGLGAGSPLVLAPQGVAFERPLTRLKEYCEVIPRLLAGEAVSYRGQCIELDGARIEDVLARDGEVGAHARIPLYLAATGPRAVEYAGEVADGVLLNVCLPVSYVRERGHRLTAGARRAGRDPSAIEVAMCIVVAPDADPRRGRDAARRFIAVYLSLFPNVARETGLEPELIRTLGEAFADGGVDAAAPCVGDDVVDLLSASGSVEDCRRRLDDYREAGVDLPILAPVEGALELTIDTLA
ncbi:MAG TPA: LLM class flavin-dependent oxidoreductase [Solirubrobacteraceae bacterium]|jgi:5,10-methylenetetrahydromethanopterin reductase